MTDTLPDRWATLDLPVLRRVAEIIDVERADEARPEGVSADLDIPQEEVTRSMIALDEAGYLEGDRMDTYGGRYVIVTDLAERGRRAVGIWPAGESVDALVEALQQAAEATEDPEEKGALRKAAGSVLSVSKGVMTDVMGAVIAKSVTG